MAQFNWGLKVLRWPFFGVQVAFQPLRFQRLANYQRGKLVAVRTVAGGKYLTPSAGTWTLAGSTVTFDYTSLGITFTASGSNINAVQYAVIYKDGASASAKLLCWSKLSSSPFAFRDPNTLTVLPAATGVFTLT
jgi:hypothetical protein